jgi:hypothetical protein
MLQRRGKNLESARNITSCDSTNTVGRAGASSWDTEEAINNRHQDRTRWKLGAGHQTTTNPAVEEILTEPATTGSAQPETRR